MNNIVKTMIESYPEHKIQKENVLRQVLQDIVLCSLYRIGFFKKCAFIGGTALRIFHNLDRFSEDLDFALLKEDKKFDFNTYVPQMKTFIESFGLNVDIAPKPRKTQRNTIVFNARFNLQDLYDQYYPEEHLNSNGRILRIEIDIDTQIINGIKTHTHYRLKPQSFSATLFGKPTLFASKIAAILLRKWGERGFKGRDLYDYIFYLSEKTPVNLKYLQSKLSQNSKWSNNETLTIDKLRKLLNNRFMHIPYNKAIDDVKPFVKDIEQLKVWNEDFFIEITQKLIEE